MTDIVEQLRAADAASHAPGNTVMLEAADEIDGLREWNAWFAAHNTELKTKNKEAAKEIERLRELKTPASRKLLNLTKASLENAEAEIEQLRDMVEQLQKTIDEIEDHYAAPTT